jgi:hypothetical protein
MCHTLAVAEERVAKDAGTLFFELGRKVAEWLGEKGSFRNGANPFAYDGHEFSSTVREAQACRNPTIDPSIHQCTDTTIA